MKKRVIAVLVVSHAAVLGAGFALGVYLLPILTAPPAPDHVTVTRAMRDGEFHGMFSRDRQDSDALHWGEGEFAIDGQAVTFAGRLAPGPDYKLYLAPTFVDTEDAFLERKTSMVLVGDVRTFDNFVVPLPAGIDPSAYDTVVVWCEAFSEFITSGQYTRRE